MRECGGRIIHKQHGHAAHGSFAAQLLDLDVACTLRAGVHIPNIDGADAVAGGGGGAGPNVDGGFVPGTELNKRLKK